jgi:sporulation protein YlmC with PRC-barrel domain
MRRRTQLALFGTAAALVLGALSVPAGEAERNRNQDRNLDTTATQTSGSFGSFERANKLIGKNVLGADNKKIGDIQDVIVDLESGRVLYVVVSAGGFLGVGDRDVAIPTAALTDVEGKSYQVNADKQKLMDAPQYYKSEDKQVEMASSTFVNSTYQHFGQRPWFEAKGAAGKFGNVQRVSKLIGMDVKTVADEKIGDVDNAIIDLRDNRVVFVILAPDRSLDLKDNLFALPPMALSMGANHDYLTTNIDRTKLAAAPHFDKNNWPNFSDRNWASQVYHYYGKQAYFESGTLRPTSEREPQKVSPENKDKKD